MDVPLVIFFLLPLFALLGFHSLVSVLNSTGSRFAENTTSDFFSAVPLQASLPLTRLSSQSILPPASAPVLVISAGSF